MTIFTADCQELGYVCDWQASADNRVDAIATLVEHINEAHGLGSTSTAVITMVSRYVTEASPANRPSTPTHRQEYAS